MEVELRHQWVGPMPVKEFFEAFLPVSNLKGMPRVSKNYFDAIPRGKDVKESDMYDPMVNATLEWLSSFEFLLRLNL
jgi:hypothetical protein